MLCYESPPWGPLLPRTRALPGADFAGFLIGDTIPDLGDNGHVSNVPELSHESTEQDTNRAVRSGPRRALVRDFPRERAIGFPAPLLDQAALRCCGDCASGLDRVPAVVEPAAPDQRPEFRKRLGELALRQMMQAESLHSRRVDDAAVRAESVDTGARGGVRAGIERLGDFADLHRRLRDERLDDGRL